jgi:hypothetical protein
LYHPYGKNKNRDDNSCAHETKEAVGFDKYYFAINNKSVKTHPEKCQYGYNFRLNI